MVSVSYICVAFLHTCPITAGALLPTARGQDETGTTTSTYCGAHNAYGYFLPDITYRRGIYFSSRVRVEAGTTSERVEGPMANPRNQRRRYRTYTRAAYILHRSLQRQPASASEGVVYNRWFPNPSEVFFNDTNSGIPEFGGEDGKRAGG